MDKSQWQTLQDMLALKQFYRQGGAGVPGLPGGQSGRASPWDEVPGGGSTANALPLQNQFVDDRQRYGQMAEDGNTASIAGYGTALGAMAFPPNPLSLALATGGIGLGALGGFMGAHGKHNARRLGYQGN